jgi:hypothetical protein
MHSSMQLGRSGAAALGTRPLTWMASVAVAAGVWTLRPQWAGGVGVTAVEREGPGAETACAAEHFLNHQCAVTTEQAQSMAASYS